MNKTLTRIITLAAALAVGVPAAAAAAPVRDVQLDLLGRTAALGEGGAEISDYHPPTKRAFVTNAAANRLDVYDLSDPAAPALSRSVDLAPFGGGPNSVAVSKRFGGLVAVAVENADTQQPGSVELFDTDGDHLRSLPAGALPDMLTFAGNGRWLLVANEGEPSADYLIDPEGSVTVIDLRRGVRRASARQASFHGVPAVGPVRVFGPGASPPQDYEPEYIAEVGGGRALVSLQENNAVAVLDIRRARFREVRSLGFKDYGLEENAMDASDRDGGVDIRPRPGVVGMYQPDAIASYRLRGRTYVVTANEGDARDYDAFSEEARVKDLALDPAVFDPAAGDDGELGRLKITTTLGDSDGDGDYERLYSYGGRSLSILDSRGAVRFDSGSAIERFLAPTPFFNLDEDEVDGRSDDKGPEPEGVDVGAVGGRPYAFLGLERSGGILAFDLGAEPGRAAIAGYVNTAPGDLSPEGIRFVEPDDSPTGEPLVLATHEVSGTLAVLAVRTSDG